MEKEADSKTPLILGGAYHLLASEAMACPLSMKPVRHLDPVCLALIISLKFKQADETTL